MKKSKLTVLCYFIIACFLIISLILTNPFINTLNASTLSQSTDIQKLQDTTSTIIEQLDTLQTDLSESKEILKECEECLIELENKTNTFQNLLIDYYIDKLSDPTFTTIYNQEYIYYTAAEQLGQIGKMAIPPLINRLDTTDDYERTLVLYALLLASQNNNVKAFAYDDYIPTYLDFDARNHPQQVQLARDWWDKYKSYF